METFLLICGSIAVLWTIAYAIRRPRTSRSRIHSDVPAADPALTDAVTAISAGHSRPNGFV